MTRKSFGWVGDVGLSENPEEEKGVRKLIGYLLDRSRYSDIARWLFMLGGERKLLFHPADKALILQALQDTDVVVYMANAHGGHQFALVRAAEEPEEDKWISAGDVESVLGDRFMKFSLVVHSEAMNNTGPGSWSHTLRDGRNTGTVAIGTAFKPSVAEWVTWQLVWAEVFFTFVDLGMRFKEAFDKASFVCPNLKGHVVFTGDESMSKKDLTQDGGGYP